MQLDAFFPLIAPEVMGCPDPVVRNALIAAADEFCRETMTWTEFMAPVSFIDGVADYALVAPADGYVVTVQDVWVSGARLIPITMSALSDVMPGWMSATSSLPVYYNQAVTRGSLRFFPSLANIASPAPTFVARGVFAPTYTATSLPDFLATHYMEPIASGAKARLMAMPGVPWANPQLAGYHAAIFDKGKDRAINEESHDRVPGAITVPSRSFGF